MCDLRRDYLRYYAAERSHRQVLAKNVPKEQVDEDLAHLWREIKGDYRKGLVEERLSREGERLRYRRLITYAEVVWQTSALEDGGYIYAPLHVYRQYRHHIRRMPKAQRLELQRACRLNRQRDPYQVPQAGHWMGL